MRNSYICACCLLLLTLVEASEYILLVYIDVWVDHELMEFLHFDHFIPLIYQDLGILDLSFLFLQLFDIEFHISTALHLGDIKITDKRLIIATESLVGDVLWVKFPHKLVIELVPLVG